MAERDSISPRWDVGLTPEAMALVEARRRRFVEDYVELTAGGFTVIEELSPYAGQLITKGPEKRIRFVQGLAAQDIISGLIEEDQMLGRKREYDWRSGSVLPSRRQVSGEMIASSHDIRAFSKGITIFSRGEQQEVSLGSAVAMEQRPSTESSGVLPLRRLPEPVGTRYRTFA